MRITRVFPFHTSMLIYLDMLPEPAIGLPRILAPPPDMKEEMILDRLEAADTNEESNRIDVGSSCLYSMFRRMPIPVDREGISLWTLMRKLGRLKQLLLVLINCPLIILSPAS